VALHCKKAIFASHMSDESNEWVSDSSSDDENVISANEVENGEEDFAFAFTDDESSAEDEVCKEVFRTRS